MRYSDSRSVQVYVSSSVCIGMSPSVMFYAQKRDAQAVQVYVSSPVCVGMSSASDALMRKSVNHTLCNRHRAFRPCVHSHVTRQVRFRTKTRSTITHVSHLCSVLRVSAQSTRSLPLSSLFLLSLVLLRFLLGSVCCFPDSSAPTSTLLLWSLLACRSRNLSLAIPMAQQGEFA